MPSSTPGGPPSPPRVPRQPSAGLPAPRRASAAWSGRRGEQPWRAASVSSGQPAASALSCAHACRPAASYL